jgi:hypothetical protein
MSFYFKNHDEYLTISKPTILAKNIIWGGFFVDFEGTVHCTSNKNGFKLFIKFFEKKNNQNSYIKGQAIDSNGSLKYKIEGSYLNQIRLIDVTTGEVEILYEEKPLIPDANMQYFFT